MKNEILPPILDVACGGKMFYFDKGDPRVLFCDIREIETTLCDGRKFAVKPDIKADFTKIPFSAETFNLVVFDPPHLTASKNGNPPTGWQFIKYGALGKDWREKLRAGFCECFRVLKYGGTLIFKWNETDIAVSEILKLTPQKPIFGHRCGKQNKTHWIVFMKIETEEK